MPHDTSDKPIPKVDRSLVTWGPIAAVIVTLLVFFGGQIMGSILAFIYPLFRGQTTKEAIAWMTDAVTGQFVLITMVEGMTLFLLMLFLAWRKSSFRALGLVRFKWKDILYALAGYGCYFVIYASAYFILKAIAPGVAENQDQQVGFDAAKHGFDLVLVFISLAVLPPITEEIITRGFLYTGLKTKLPKLAAALIASVLFATAHLQFGNGKPLLWIVALDTFILSLVLIYLREKTGSLWASILLHGLKNSVAFLVLFVFK
jgi:uncharacterized protein